MAIEEGHCVYCNGADPVTSGTRGIVIRAGEG